LRHLTDEDITNKFKETLSIDATASFYGVNSDTISKILKRNNVNAGKKITYAYLEDKKDEIIRQYRSGKNIKELAIQFLGASGTGILHALKRWGIQIRSTAESKREKKISITCKGCKKEFKVFLHKGKMIFCGDKCRRSYEKNFGMKPRKERECVVCGNPMILTQGSKRKICSQKCKKIFWKEQFSKYAKFVEIICAKCNKPKKVKESTYNRYLTKFCSRNCYAKSFGGNRKTKPHLIVRDFLIKSGISFQEEHLIGPYWADFLTSNGICIEVQGDYWYCNPRKYKKDFFHKLMKKTAQQIWNKDKKRKDFFRKIGYKTFFIWEYDIMNNRDKSLNKLLMNINLHLNISLPKENSFNFQKKACKYICKSSRR